MCRSVCLSQSEYVCVPMCVYFLRVYVSVRVYMFLRGSVCVTKREIDIGRRYVFV